MIGSSSGASEIFNRGNFLLKTTWYGYVQCKVKVTSVHKLMRGNTNKYFVYWDSRIPDVYIHIFATTKQSIQYIDICIV